MCWINDDQLLLAMQMGQCLDGAAIALGGNGLVPFSPPVLQAGFELGETNPSSIQSDPRQNPLRVVDFEALTDKTWRTIEYPKETTSLPKLTPKMLLKALARARDQISTVPKDFDHDVVFRMRGGLQISGVHIVNGPDRLDAVETISLANVPLPFSLRLIGCVIDVPLSLNNCELVTLDLSGSVLAGLDATFLKASGSVRLRRTVVQTPVDFGGARIHGYFDGCDLVIKPFDLTPANQGFDGDRGMLNLSQATIDNDIRLERATIWGGLAMRGLKTQRSIFLDEAVILSPVAVLERLASSAIVEARLTRTVLAKLTSRALVQMPPTRRSESHNRLIALNSLPTKLKPEQYNAGRRYQAKRAAEMGNSTFIKLGTNHWEKTCLNPLLIESLRVRTSSVRADGLETGGSIFAQSITSHGRMRLKYARITGGLSLWLTTSWH